MINLERRANSNDETVADGFLTAAFAVDDWASGYLALPADISASKADDLVRYEGTNTVDMDLAAFAYAPDASGD